MVGCMNIHECRELIRELNDKIEKLKSEFSSDTNALYHFTYRLLREHLPKECYPHLHIITSEVVSK